MMVLFILRTIILQTHRSSHPMGLDVWFLVGPFVYFHTLRVRTVKALVRVRGWAGSPEPLLVAYVVSTIIPWAGSDVYKSRFLLATLTSVTPAIYSETQSHQVFHKKGKWAATWQKVSVHLAKTQISLGICPVWSESSLSAWRNLGSLVIHWVHSEDWSDWADAQAHLSLRWVQSLCWFCHVAAQIVLREP